MLNLSSMTELKQIKFHLIDLSLAIGKKCLFKNHIKKYNRTKSQWRKKSEESIFCFSPFV